MDYGISIDIQNNKDYVKLFIRVLEDILERVVDCDEMRICVSNMLMEEHKKLSSIYQNEHKELEKNKEQSARKVSFAESVDEEKHDLS